MRRAVLSGAILTLALTAATPAAQRFPPDLNRRGAAVERLLLWVEAVRVHRPRVLDEGARRVAQWTPAELDDVSIDLLSLFRLMDAPRTSSFAAFIGTPGREVRQTVVYTRSELARLRALALSLGGRDPNRRPSADDDPRIAAAQNALLKRGAALHTTIGLADSIEAETRSSGPVTPQQEWLVQFADGRQVSTGRAANHWRFARTLLGRVTPAPAADAAVRTWYRASSAALLGGLQLHASHFKAALDLFPDDPVLLALTGSLHEALASPFVQAFVRGSSLPTGVLSVGSLPEELSEAETYFRRALAADPAAAEARLHLGRVLSLQERYAEALGELERMDAAASTALQYYRSLFVGDCAQSLGRVADARTAYERAAALYPNARTPWIAMSQLAASTGDLSGVVPALDRAISNGDPPMADDPFWTYLAAPGLGADARLADAYRALMVDAP